jgi:uncharacterized membrane protein YeaQ/YmgE (transglycosylase-associated protein family)
VSAEFPEPRPGPSRRRLVVRLACSAVVAVVLLAWQFDLVLAVLPRLWPPTSPTSRWASLLLLLVGSFVVLPGIVGSLVGDWLVDRWLRED